MDSKQKGNITELEVLTYITKLGYQVSIPFGDRERYDQIWDINGKLLKIQVKTSRLSDDSSYIIFSCRSNTRIQGKTMQFKFEDTILWDNMSDEEKTYWTKVSAWVSWFQQKFAYIKNTYDILNTTGKDISTIKLRIIHDYLILMCPTTEDSAEVKAEKNKYINALVDYLIDCFENRI